MFAAITLAFLLQATTPDEAEAIVASVAKIDKTSRREVFNAINALDSIDLPAVQNSIGRIKGNLEKLIEIYDKEVQNRIEKELPIDEHFTAKELYATLVSDLSTLSEDQQRYALFGRGRRVFRDTIIDELRYLLKTDYTKNPRLFSPPAHAFWYDGTMDQYGETRFWQRAFILAYILEEDDADQVVALAQSSDYSRYQQWCDFAWQLAYAPVPMLYPEDIEKIKGRAILRPLLNEYLKAKTDPNYKVQWAKRRAEKFAKVRAMAEKITAEQTELEAQAKAATDNEMAEKYGVYKTVPVSSSVQERANKSFDYLKQLRSAPAPRYKGAIERHVRNITRALSAAPDRKSALSIIQQTFQMLLEGVESLKRPTERTSRDVDTALDDLNEAIQVVYEGIAVDADTLSDIAKLSKEDSLHLKQITRYLERLKATK